MDIEEPVAKRNVPKNLEPMSVAELECYIGDLESEIARARMAIEKKRSIRGGAEALFRR